MITFTISTAVQNLVEIPPWGLLGKQGQTARQIFTLNGSNDTDSCKGVPFGFC